MKALLLATALVGLTACGTSRHDSATDDPNGEPAESGTLSAFVIDVVQNQTSDSDRPVAGEAFFSLPDPDGDRNALEAYSSLF